jgi:hypothetical protein
MLYFLFLILCFYGRPQQSYPQLQYEPDTGEGYEAGNGGAEVFACAGVPVSVACEGFAGEAGYSASEIQNRRKLIIPDFGRPDKRLYL